MDDMVVLPVVVCVLGPYFSVGASGGFGRCILGAIATLPLRAHLGIASILAGGPCGSCPRSIGRTWKPTAKPSAEYPADSTGVIYENLDLQLRRPLPPLCFEESVKRVAKGRGGHLTCREGLRDKRYGAVKFNQDRVGCGKKINWYWYQMITLTGIEWLVSNSHLPGRAGRWCYSCFGTIPASGPNGTPYIIYIQWINRFSISMETIRSPLFPVFRSKSIRWYPLILPHQGYCFLLVDAFAALLCSLGFQVSLHTATCSPVPEPEVRGVSTMMGYELGLSNYDWWDIINGIMVGIHSGY